ncbi:MAG TPA: hypothetical protein HA257_07620, partial [Candidatus Methanoperedenaceae archaeon]|nr:hypothetical protein [Candidatus Methanoperedenaceae archaeon]
MRTSGSKISACITGSCAYCSCEEAISLRTIDWDDDENTIVMIDQTLLPAEFRMVECRTIGSLCEAIKSLRVRGAPALGAAGGFGIALAARTSSKKSLRELMHDIESAGDAIKQTRPTAINLAWGVDRVISAVRKAKDVRKARKIALREAKDIADEDVMTNMEIGRHGAALLDDGDTVLTHCNAGRLACVD